MSSGHMKTNMAKREAKQGRGGNPVIHEPSMAAPEPARRDAWLAAIAEDRIAELTYPAIMARGRQVLASGAIQRPEFQATADDEMAVLATIVGTEPYQVRLGLAGRGRRVALESSCSCPHAADGWFCKHQVALALWLHANLAGEAVPVDADAAKQHAATLKRAATTAARTAALQDFLTAQPAEVLAERLMHFATLVPELKHELHAWQATAEAAGDAKSVSKLITQLLPLRESLDWRDSTVYARQAAPLLPVLQSALQAQAPVEALKLVQRAYVRLQQQLQCADDSDGQLGDLCAEVGALWLEALERAGPQPASFGERYAELRDAECCSFIPHAQALAAMGEAAARRYGAQLRAAFEAALAAAQARPAAARRDPFGGGDGLWSARQDYLDHLRATGDAEERLRVLRAGLENELDHLALIEELHRLGRAREALDCAERAYRLFPDSGRIEDELLAVYERDGWDAEALAVHRARFDRRPSGQAALAVLEAARRARQDDEPLRDAMWRALVAAEDAALKRWKAGLGQRLPAARDVSERVAWLMGEQRLDEALALVQPPHVASPEVVEALADGLPREHDAAAAALLRRVLGVRMPRASSPYTDELRLVRRVVARLPAAEATLWLTGLRAEYRAKRNFIRGMP